VLFYVPCLDTLFASCLQLKTDENCVLFSHAHGKKSEVLNEFKQYVLYTLELMIRKIGRLEGKAIGVVVGSPIMANLAKFCQFVLSEITLCVKHHKYYQLACKSVNLLDIGLKLLKTYLKLPSLEQFFSSCRQQLLFGVIVPLL